MYRVHGGEGFSVEIKTLDDNLLSIHVDSKTQVKDLKARIAKENQSISKHNMALKVGDRYLNDQEVIKDILSNSPGVILT